MRSALKIGELADATATTAPTIRYYESIGLLPPARRPPGSQRVYGDADVRRLTFIRRCRDFGFPIEQVRELVALVQDRVRSCMDARDLAMGRLSEVRAKLKELRSLERHIAEFIATCDASCAGGAGADCVILDKLALSPGRRAPARAGAPRRGK